MNAAAAAAGVCWGGGRCYEINDLVFFGFEVDVLAHISLLNLGLARVSLAPLSVDHDSLASLSLAHLLLEQQSVLQVGARVREKLTPHVPKSEPVVDVPL